MQTVLRTYNLFAQHHRVKFWIKHVIARLLNIVALPVFLNIIALPVFLNIVALLVVLNIVALPFFLNIVALPGQLPARLTHRTRRGPSGRCSIVTTRHGVTYWFGVLKLKGHHVSPF